MSSGDWGGGMGGAGDPESRGGASRPTFPPGPLVPGPLRAPPDSSVLPRTPWTPPHSPGLLRTPPDSLDPSARPRPNKTNQQGACGQTAADRYDRIWWGCRVGEANILEAHFARFFGNGQLF